MKIKCCILRPCSKWGGGGGGQVIFLVVSKGLNFVRRGGGGGIQNLDNGWASLPTRAPRHLNNERSLIYSIMFY